MSAELKNSTLQTNPPRIGFAVNTMERIDFTARILPALDCGGFDLIWCDGSRTPEGRAFASREHFKTTPLIEINHDVTGGPDAAIKFSLKRLLALGYDYVGLIENDIQLKPDWLPAMMSAWQAAEQDGFQVGSVTARSMVSRVLAQGPQYVVKWNMGAGMVLFSRAAAEAVLADYRLSSAQEVHHLFRTTTGVDLSPAWELFMEKPDRPLGADWRYASSCWKSGLISVGTVPTMAENIDVDIRDFCRTDYVRAAQEVWPPYCMTIAELKTALACWSPCSSIPAPIVAGTNSPLVAAGNNYAAVCPVCEIPAAAVVVKNNQTYHRCSACDCVFTPHIEAQNLETENHGNELRHDQNQDAVRLQRLTNALGERPERVIDFGCGQGETTRFLEAQGIAVVGIDQDTKIQLSDVADESVDGIMMVEVIEHLYAPREVFSEFARVLKPGGIAYIESSFADGENLALWEYLNPAIGHCTTHTFRSMKRLADKNNSEITWLNSNVCCFTKKITAKNSGQIDQLEIIGEGCADPLVTIAVFTDRAEKKLSACLESLSHQTIFDRCDIIVVDSGSPENERAIIADSQQKFSNLRYVLAPRETLYAGWNQALALSRSRYFVAVNADDGLRNDALEIFAAALEKNSDCALAYGDVAWTSKPNDAFPSTHIVSTVKYPDYAPAEALFGCFTGSLQFFRADSLKKTGGFDVSLKCAGDYEAALKLVVAKQNAVRVPEVLSLSFQNTESLAQSSERTAREHKTALDHVRATLDIGKILLAKNNNHADAWAALGQRAECFAVPWNKQPQQDIDFAIECYHHALHIDPQNEFAGLGLAALHFRLNRLQALAPALVERWPKMQQWIPRAASGEAPNHPEVPHACIGPVFRPQYESQRPTEKQLTAEPAGLRPWIARIAGRHVYLSEDIFPRPSGMHFTQPELQEGTNRLMALLRELPPFRAHFGGAGDLLVLLASFYDDKPDSVLFSYPNSIGATQAMLEAFPKLSKIYFLPQHADGFFHIILRRLSYELKNCVGAGATPRHGYEEEWIPGLDVAKKYGVKMNPRWAAALKNNSGSKKIAVAPRGSLTGMVGSKKNIILPELWPQVIGHIVERGFEPVIIGLASEAKEYPALPGCTDARHESFAGQMKIVGECAGLVGADSWAKSFSALAEIPTIVFEPIKGAELTAWKDPSDWVFIEPWKSLKMVKTLAQFRREFDARIVHRGQPQKISAPKIAWSGSFVDYGSLSHINRELSARLEKNFLLTRVGQNAIAPKLKQDKALVDCAKKLSAVAPANTAITVRHQWPPDWSRPVGGALVVIQPWEFGSLPQAWLDNAENVDEFWVPSPLVRHMYVDSGIAPEKVQVIPNGVDTQKFRPGVKPLKLATKKKFKFLFVGGTIHRKGPDVLLEAFSKAFTAADDVCLVVKDFGGDSCYRGQTAAEAIRALQQTPGAPEIVYLDQEIASDEMPSLYAACDCLVLPYRGEGFGMPVLEAMACGLPVVVTSQGATDSFVTKDAGWKIPSRLQRLNGRVGEIPLVKSGWLLEPNKEQLTNILKIAAAHPMECRQRGANGRGIVERRFDWNHIAAIVQWRLGVISERLAESAQVPSTQTEVSRLTAPEVAQIGDLKNARTLLDEKNLEAAWAEANNAVVKRPFHPAGFLLLAEIAKAAGAGTTAKGLAEQAQRLTLRWDAPKKFLSQKLSGDAKPAWINDIPRITNRGSRLTVCLITKNEEKFLPGCLASIKDLATQIVVADTGSTDRTVEIAKEFGAEVQSFAWCDDFAAARNAALAHATGDWILMLDADEELPAAQHAKLRKHMSDVNAIGFRLPLVNVGQEIEGRSFVPRLLRNAPGVFFHGRIHEQVFPSLMPLCKAWNLTTALGEAELKHHGYTKEVVRDRNKIERNLKLLRLGLLETPDDANLVMNLGMELGRSGELQNGLTKYREAFALMSAQPTASVVPELREALLSQLATHLYKVRGHDEVVRILNSPLAKNGGLTASLHFALGLSLFELKNFVGAAEQMRQCLAKRDQPALTPINVDIHSGAPWHCRALCFSRLEEKAEAEKCFTAAVSAGNRTNEARLDFAKFLAEQNRGIEALQQLHAVVETDKQSLLAWKLGGQIALSRNEFLEFAQDWTSEAIQYFPGDGALQAQRAEALLLAGNVAEALPLWRAVREKDGLPRSVAALIVCAVCAGEKISAPGSKAEEEQISRVFIGWYQRLLGAGAHAVVGNLNSQLEKVATMLPTAGNLLRTALTEAAQVNAPAIG
jgi:glycosyltransferase involved in cell wall biosynthesis/Tfp pilus assembly protein PilF